MASVEIAVVGRGLIGAAAGRHLAEAGRRIALIGPGEPADYGTSSGPFASHYDEGRVTRITATDSVWSTLAARSIGRYADIAHRSGFAFHEPCGLAFVRADRAVDDAAAATLGADARPVSSQWLQEATGIAVPDDVERHIVFEGPPAGRINPRRMVAAQTRLTELAGGRVLDTAVSSIAKEGGRFRLATELGDVVADRLLMATGAYGTSLVGVDLALERRLRTIVLAEIAASDAIPTLIFDNPPSADLDELYWVPPVPFPDGRTMLKIGGDSVPMQTATTSDDIARWFQQGGSTTEAAALQEMVRLLLPDTTVTSWDHKPCVVTYTPTARPYIDWIDTNVAVALGGSGSAAKSADEIGRLAASLFGDREPRDPILDSFRV